MCQAKLSIRVNGDEMHDLCSVLSDASNRKLQEAGAMLDCGRDEDALNAYRESRRLHLLHKRLYGIAHPDLAKSGLFI